MRIKLIGLVAFISLSIGSGKTQTNAQESASDLPMTHVIDLPLPNQNAEKKKNFLRNDKQAPLLAEPMSLQSRSPRLAAKHMAGLPARQEASEQGTQDFVPTGLQPLNSGILNRIFSTAEEPQLTNRLNQGSMSSRDPHLGESRQFHVHWAADNLAHKTVYFEDVPLERHGLTKHPLIQPACSMTRFVAEAVVIPIQLLRVPAHKYFYTQREGRPGSVPPK